METSDFIAIGAFIIAAFSFIGQRKFNKRNEKLQTENNRISGSVLQLEEEFKDYIKEKGEQKVLDVFTHFFIIQLNCWEPNGKMKTDLNSLNQFIRELKQISKELETVNEQRTVICFSKKIFLI